MASNSINRCCFMAKLWWYEDGWRLPVTEVTEFWGQYLRLYRCKYCQSNWVMRNRCEGHRDWVQYWERIDSPEAYEELKLAQKVDDERRLAELKEWRRLNGLE